MPSVAIVPASSGVVTSASAVRYRNLLADQLGLYDGNLSLSSLASGPDAARYLVIDALRDDEAAREAWAGGYAYARTGVVGEQYKLLGHGYHGRYGALAVSNPPSVPVPVGTPIDLSWPLPIKRRNAIKGIDDLVNEALARCWILARLSIVGTGSRSISLAPYTFITSDNQIRGIYDTFTNGLGVPLELSQYGERVTANGASRTIVTDLTYSAADTFEVEVFVRADHLVYDGSGWLYPTTPGLLNDTYRAAAPEHWVVTLGMVKALQQLRKMAMMDRAMDHAERGLQLGEIDRRLRTWGAAARKIILDEMPRPLARPTPSFIDIADDTYTYGWG